MAKDKKTKDINTLISKEIERLSELFNDIDDDKKELAEGLISNAAFLSTQMDLLKDDINKNGVMVEYKNGENQYGYKRSPSVETYNSFINHYTKIIQQLNNLLPNDIPTVKDEKVEFIKPK